MNGRLALCIEFALCVGGCGEELRPASSNSFALAEYGRVRVKPSAGAEEGDLANTFLSAGSSFEVIEYEVPSLLCVRTDSNDYLHIPEVTTQPGAPGVFWVVAPADLSKPVVMVFHGNGLDFIEAEATLFTHAAPRTAQD